MRKSWLLRIWLVVGMAFLYIPMLTLIIYSFNNSDIVTLWGGWSLKWYATLAQDDTILSAAWLSIRIGVMASTAAVILGTMLAVAFNRYGPFRGKTLLYGMAITPLMMPDVITGLSLLLMFVSLQTMIGWPVEQGFATILIAHTTFCVAYAVIVIQARLGSLDRSIEEAAMDLGAKPVKTFFYITLPQVFPSLVVAWLLSFTLSIDDLVITSFVSGPDTTTLPMYIYSSIRNNITPEINALATFLILFVLIALLIGSFLISKWRKAE
jgi:putrescine transport system permease protein